MNISDFSMLCQCYRALKDDLINSPLQYTERRGGAQFTTQISPFDRGHCSGKMCAPFRVGSGHLAVWHLSWPSDLVATVWAWVGIRCVPSSFHLSLEPVSAWGKNHLGGTLDCVPVSPNLGIPLRVFGVRTFWTHARLGGCQCSLMFKWQGHHTVASTHSKSYRNCHPMVPTS